LLCIAAKKKQSHYTNKSKSLAYIIKEMKKKEIKKLEKKKRQEEKRRTLEERERKEREIRKEEERKERERREQDERRMRAMPVRYLLVRKERKAKGLGSASKLLTVHANMATLRDLSKLVFVPINDDFKELGKRTDYEFPEFHWTDDQVHFHAGISYEVEKQYEEDMMVVLFERLAQADFMLDRQYDQQFYYTRWTDNEQRVGATREVFVFKNSTGRYGLLSSEANSSGAEMQASAPPRPPCNGASSSSSQ
jgi:hypothetical protein